jgi:hypothetical protein
MITVEWAPPDLGMGGITDASATQVLDALHSAVLVDDRH